MKLSLTVTAVGAGEFYEPISNEMNEMFHFLSARRLRVMRTKKLQCAAQNPLIPCPLPPVLLNYTAAYKGLGLFYGPKRKRMRRPEWKQRQMR